MIPCASDKHRAYWVSDDIKKIDYAKKKCLECEKLAACFVEYTNLYDDSEYVAHGVWFGTSKLDRLFVRNGVKQDGR